MAKYCISKSSLENLFSLQVKQNIRNLTLDPTPGFNLKDRFAASVAKFSKKTLTLELYSALLLSAFYFGEEVDTNICFDMKSSFNPGTFKNDELSFADLEEWVETATAIDCYISHQSQEFRFQIKSFPEKYKVLSTETLAAYIKDLSQKKYGNMSDVILTLVPQVKAPFSYLPADLKALKENLSRPNISFREVILLLNVEGKDSLFRAFKKGS